MLPSREWRGGTREEYETQHFGFGSQRLSIALRDVIEHNIVSNVRSMEQSAIGSLDLEGDDKTGLIQSCDKLISTYIRCAEPAISRIDVEIDKLLHIPDTTVLTADEERAGHIADEDFDKLKAEVSALEKRVQRAALMESLLKAEEEELKSIEKHCELTQLTKGYLESFSKKLIDKTDVVHRLDRETQSVSEAAFMDNK